MLVFGPIALLRLQHVMTPVLTFFIVVGANVQTIIVERFASLALEIKQQLMFGFVQFRKDVLLIQELIKKALKNDRLSLNYIHVIKPTPLIDCTNAITHFILFIWINLLTMEDGY